MLCSIFLIVYLKLLFPSHLCAPAKKNSFFMERILLAVKFNLTVLPKIERYEK
jgi:hypothetical protein